MTKPLSEEQTLLITGAGMSKPLGLPTTKGLYDALRELMDIGYAQKPRRIAERLKVIDKEVFELDDVAKNDIINTLSMLHDGDGATREKEAAEVVDSAKDKYFKLYENYFPGVKMPVLRRHFSSYTRTYDWLSLKSIAHSMYNSRRHIDSSIDKEHEDDGDGFNLVDILTTIQNSIFDNITITTKEIFPKETEDTTGIYYCDRTRLEK